MPKQGSLLAYSLSRLVLAIPMLFILLTAVFIVLRILPGDPIAALYGGRAPPAQVLAARERLGLNRPYWEQYVIYIRQIFTGDFGTSVGGYNIGRNVLETVTQKLPATVELTIGAMIIATTVGILVGAVSGVNRDKPVDVIGRLYGTVIFVIPIFWLGLLLQFVFANGLGLLPANGRYDPGQEIPPAITGLLTIDSLIRGRFDQFIIAVRHLFLPTLTLGLILSGFFAKSVRANLLRTMTADYVEAARARGIKERVIFYRYAFKNAFIPIFTILGLQFAILFAGAVITERTFSWDGMGTLLLDSIGAKDYTMIQGAIVVYAFIIVIVSVAIDIVNGFVDPRVRY